MRPIEALPSQPAELLPVFQRLLPTSVLAALVDSVPQKFYQRIFGPLVLIWGFIHQQLSPDHSCDGVLSHLVSGALDEWEASQSVWVGGSPPALPLSQRVPRQNSSYCQGRKRLPLSLLQQCMTVTACNLHREATASLDWQGRTVLLLDGSTLLTQATPDLVAHYGRHSNQHGPGHWPVLHCVAAFDLHTGAVAEVVEGKLRTSEQELAIQLFQQTAASASAPGVAVDDEPPIHVADRNFGIFLIAQVSAACGQDVVLRLTESRARALLRRSGHSMPRSGEEVEVEWYPSPQDQVLSKVAPEAQFPLPVPETVRGRLLYWRLERSGYRPVDLYLFTTLLDRERYPAVAMVELYGLRWHVEINLRYVKSALGLAQLQAKSVEMVRKELVAGLLAYNLIRGLMALAAIQANLSPLDLSFQRCWRRLQAMTAVWRMRTTDKEIAEQLSHLLKMLGYCTLYRSKKKRTAERAIRGRPTVYPFLKGDRTQNNPEGIKS